jgi:hypothetical protein
MKVGQEHIRQLVICADAMEWNLVRQWANVGKLPVFRRLMEQGMRRNWQPLRRNSPIRSGPACTPV